MKKKLTLLSHPLSPETPAYGGGEGMTIKPITKIAEGHSANTTQFIFPNHLGTHIDTPRHFFDDGDSLTDYPTDFWLFENPVLVDIPCVDGYLVSIDDVKTALTEKNDLLLIRTGFEAYRKSQRYWQRNPGLDPQLAKWLRKHYPNLRVIGMDFISVTSRLHREKGRKAHQAFLDPKGIGAPILLMEDMALACIESTPFKVVISPLMVLNADGGPCTVLSIN